MEIHMSNVSFSCNKYQVIRALARALHQPYLSGNSGLPVNFDVSLAKDRTGRRKHGGFGSLTLPDASLGHRFMGVFDNAEGYASDFIYVGDRDIVFEYSTRAARPDIVENISRLPYQDPQALEEQERRSNVLNNSEVDVHTLQFGWECRDNVFSIEWELPWTGISSLAFSDEKRELRVYIDNYQVAIRYASIETISAHNTGGNEPEHAIWMTLSTAPHFEQRHWNTEKKRTRLQSLPYLGHSAVVSYTSVCTRLVLPSLSDLQRFLHLAGVARLPNVQAFVVPVERRGLFSPPVMDELARWQSAMSWDVAFQIEAIMRRLLVDAKEMLKLLTPIRAMIMQYGSRYTAAFLKVFGNRAANWWFREEREQDFFTMDNCFLETQQEFLRSNPPNTYSEAPTDINIVQGLHVTVTPTNILLDGPYPEQTNRVLRSFAHKYHDNFLRVSFMEEGKTQFRFDRDVDGPEFVEDRVGTLMRNGLTIAGRKFEFLAYSMSALKEHTVWFLRPFVHERTGHPSVTVNAASIIASLGTFDQPTLYCPARYAARISQAFTATDQATVEVEEVGFILDIKTADGRYCFTDGVGTMSPELARLIWAELKTTRKRAGRSNGHPRAYQVRFQGSKGMLSVDHNLHGSVMMLRPSMRKFDAPDAPHVEIARAFDAPGGYFLNRPLIMLLEGLGVQYSVFEQYQDAAVADVHQSTQSLHGAARLLEKYGLGTSFRIPSVLYSLAKLGLDHLVSDEFYTKLLEFAVNHILRDLKNHARIPVPKGHTLVGVADVHNELAEDEIYACIKPKSGPTVYLEGPVLISRSPTIHPGDAQVAQAIGRPAAGSSFETEPLPNMVVFSTKGSRPLPSCLGGGDLDGDLYNLIPLDECPEFWPEHFSDPASYDPAEKKMLDRPSTRDDVIDFVVDYINSDVVGIIAITWLIIADQSQDGIWDEDCMWLSQLHSNAVDFQKSGTPVALDDIPRHKFRAKPDWNAPETVNVAHSATHYKSERAIGKLFRRVDLPAVDMKREARRQRKRMKLMQKRDVSDLAESLSNVGLSDAESTDTESTYGGSSRSSATTNEDVVLRVIRERVDEFIDVGVEVAPETREEIARMFWNYSDDLQAICATRVLSHRRTTTLTEEEAVVGTIVEKTSQTRKRKEVMSKLRQDTDHLVKEIRVELAAADDEAHEVGLKRAWLAWQLSLRESELFGAKSFGWVALSSIFDSIKEIEERDKEVRSNQGSSRGYRV